MDRNGPIKSSPQRPIKSDTSAATCVLGFSGIFPCECIWLVSRTVESVPSYYWLVSRAREAGSLIFISVILYQSSVNGGSWCLTWIFYVLVFADFWEVFGTVEYFYTHEVVADQSNAVCLLFVCKIDRWKPVKYDRLCWLCRRIYAQQIIKWLLLPRTIFARTHTLAPVLCTTSCLDVRRSDAAVW